MIRGWHEWTHEEKELFTRLIREGWNRAASPVLVAHLTGLKIKMFERPLNTDEIAEGLSILDVINLTER